MLQWNLDGLPTDEDWDGLLTADLARSMPVSVFRDGVPPVPPVAQLVSCLVRSYVETDWLEIGAIDTVALLTVSVVATLPTCDLCGTGRAARYDAHHETGLAGYFCPPCYVAHSRSPLGAGRGQFLLEPGEVPKAADLNVWMIVDRCLNVLAKRGANIYRAAFDEARDSATSGTINMPERFPLSEWPW
jgi:hypothetical protein